MKKNNLIMAACAVVLVVAGAFAGYFSYGLINRPETDVNYESIKKVWDSIHTMHVNRDNLDDEKIANYASSAMIAALDDKYAYFFNPAMYQRAQNNTAGFYIDIGIYSAMSEDGSVIITGVTTGSPASDAGILAGDVILKVAGTEIAGMEMNAVTRLLQGEENTEVTMTVDRGGESLDFVVKRSRIIVRSVSYQFEDGIAYIWLDRFGERTAAELKECLQRADEDQAVGIIIDLTSNGGGIINTLIPAAGYFLDEGQKIMATHAYDGVYAYVVGNRDYHTDKPVVIFTDGHTASAAEAFACALQENGRAVVAGQRSYGKGAIDVTVPLPNGSAIYISIGKWNTPTDDNIEGRGIIPDYELPVDSDWFEWAKSYFAGTD